MFIPKTERDLEGLRASGRILAIVLNNLREEAHEGVRLLYLDELARELLKSAGAKPAFLGYKGESSRKPYPAAICTSLNDQIVHGLPTNYVLKEGDVLKIDLGADYQGYITDAAVTLAIGKIGAVAEKLISATQTALHEAIKVCKLGNHTGDIGWVIEQTVKNYGFSVVKNLTGHGVGFALHEEPTVYNYGERNTGVLLQAGMVLAVEPMVSAGLGETVDNPDGSFSTKDKSLSAHFEKTVAITESGPEILTPFE